MSEANKELVRRHFEQIWNNKDLAAADELMADELMAQDYLEHAIAPFGQAEPGKVDGPAAMRQTAQWLLAQFPDLHMTMRRSSPRGIRWRSGSCRREPTWGRSTGWCRPLASGSRPARATGSGSKAAGWPSTGQPGRTWWRCCSWGSCSLPAGPRPSVRRDPWR